MLVVGLAARLAECMKLKCNVFKKDLVGAGIRRREQ